LYELFVEQFYVEIELFNLIVQMKDHPKSI